MCMCVVTQRLWIPWFVCARVHVYVCYDPMTHLQKLYCQRPVKVTEFLVHLHLAVLDAEPRDLIVGSSSTHFGKDVKVRCHHVIIQCKVKYLHQKMIKCILKTISMRKAAATNY